VCLALSPWQGWLLHLPHLLILGLATPALPAVRAAATTKQQTSTAGTCLRLLDLPWLRYCTALKVWFGREFGFLGEFKCGKHVGSGAGLTATVDACREVG
jgi:hypothetical protein